VSFKYCWVSLGEVHLLYELGCIIPWVGNLTEDRYVCISHRRMISGRVLKIESSNFIMTNCQRHYLTMMHPRSYSGQSSKAEGSVNWDWITSPWMSLWSSYWLFEHKVVSEACRFSYCHKLHPVCVDVTKFQDIPSSHRTIMLIIYFVNI
jgi:hypothetical protein